MTGLFDRDVYLGTLPNYYQIDNNDCINAHSYLITSNRSGNLSTPLTMHGCHRANIYGTWRGYLNSFVIVNNVCTKFHETLRNGLFADTRSQTVDCLVLISCSSLFYFIHNT